MAPVMINFQIKCAMADMWRELHKDVLEELSSMYSSVYSGDKLKNWPTIFILALVLLAIWECMQFDCHLRGVSTSTHLLFRLIACTLPLCYYILFRFCVCRAAQNIAMFVIARIIMGFGTGASSIAAPVYLSETVLAKLRAVSLALLYVFWYVGFIFSWHQREDGDEQGGRRPGRDNA
ncbi:uncharacterized protein PV07_08738 [Cladophialophora immunda]|uniref:Major facilitator superfamily (MFS) profile domain-containing protein n=1 Tax=Cladophialophora immunda TaxID=569365 RepID=A0A0D2AKS7_9EURO|nr:uncharacterized protein PV07_08738 [Cladophialophora immunda]KIW25572.1 hypothetical protein PV07_08738 [Cladophialophora immunda]